MCAISNVFMTQKHFALHFNDIDEFNSSKSRDNVDDTQMHNEYSSSSS